MFSFICKITLFFIAALSPPPKEKGLRREVSCTAQSPPSPFRAQCSSNSLPPLQQQELEASSEMLIATMHLEKKLLH